MALRQAMRSFAPLVGATTSRAFGTSALRATELQKESIASFMENFEKHKPIATMDLPSTPSSFLKPAKEVPATIPEKMTLNFYVPHEIEFDGAEVTSVEIPATSGDFGVLPGHVPTVAQMRPGVVAVTVGEKEVHKVSARAKTTHREAAAGRKRRSVLGGGGLDDLAGVVRGDWAYRRSRGRRRRAFTGRRGWGGTQP